MVQLEKLPPFVHCSASCSQIAVHAQSEGSIAHSAPEIQKTLGYIPGEISFLDDMNGDEFLKFMHDMRGTMETARQKMLIEMFELDPKGKIKKFSKGMKQKLGIITAFMHNPDVLILDEPTSGLDPLMQDH